MLSPLQEQVAEIIAGLEEARDFALAGGGALIARGDVRRQTRDLDFFGLTAAAVDRLVPAVDRALRDAGMVVHHIQANPGFARLVVERGDDRTELDLMAVERRYGLNRLCQLAVEKDRGFTPKLFAGRSHAVDDDDMSRSRARCSDGTRLSSRTPVWRR